MIYAFFDSSNNEAYYFCPNQETIDEGKTIGYTGNFIIGGQEDADALVVSCRENWLVDNNYLFTANKDIDSPDVPDATVWTVCDLDTEPPNTDEDYQIFDVINGSYILVVGLDNAKNLEQSLQNDAKVWFVASYATWESWPPLNKPTSTGTQTL